MEKLKMHTGAPKAVGDGCFTMEQTPPTAVEFMLKVNELVGGYGDKVLECDHFWELDPRRDDWIPQKTVDDRYDRDEKWKGIK